MHYYRLLLILISLGTAGTCVAAVMEVLPNYSLMPSLNGLNIAYFTQQDKVKITLYIVNHETFPATCDAEYQGGPDTENTREQIVMPDKAIAFVFTYPKKTDSLYIQFICVKAQQAATENGGAIDAPSTAPETTDVPLIIETDLSVTH